MKPDRENDIMDQQDADLEDAELEAMAMAELVEHKENVETTAT